MMRTLNYLVFTLAVMLGMHGSLVVAQDDPFGAPEPMAPMAAPMPMPLPGAPEDNRPKGPPPTEDVLILSIRESNPTTPDELIAAVKALLDYGAYDEAKRYLTQLLGSKPTVGQLAAAQRKYGSALFIRLAGEKRVAPEGIRVAEAVMKSARRLYDDPERLRTLAKQATDADATGAQREEAVVELRNAGATAVAPLLEVLGNANLPQHQAHARDALVALGQAAVEPLIGVLESDNVELRVQTIAVLTRIKTARVVPFLLRPAHDPEEQPRVQAIAREALKRLAGGVPSKGEVETYLFNKANDYFGGMSPVPADQDGLVILWRWDAQLGATAPRYYPANTDAILLPDVRGIDGLTKTIENAPASVIMAALTARDLYALFPETLAYKRLFIATHLEAGQLMAGLGQPLAKGPGTVHGLVSRVEPAAIEDAMGWSMKNDHFAAATAAAQVLGDVGDATLLTSSTGAPRPLTLALRHPDRRLRFAAAEAILKFNSPTSFPGASYVPETLGYLAGTVGTRRALVADPRGEQAGTLGGLLATAGYDVEIASTGNDAVAKALKQPDFELVFLCDAIDGDDLTRTWQQLRKDPRTANLLIAFTAREETLLALLEKAETDPLCRAMPHIHTREILDFQLEQLFRKAGTKFVPYAERQRQAAAALDHLSALASAGAAAKHYDLQRQQEPAIRALTTPGLAVHAAPFLGALGTHEAQRALVDLASDSNYDVIDRQAAAKAFAQAVAGRGTLLTTKEIGAQYDRYNASETQDAETQQVLAAVLDVIEQNKER